MIARTQLFAPWQVGYQLLVAASVLCLTTGPAMFALTLLVMCVCGARYLHHVEGRPS